MDPDPVHVMLAAIVRASLADARMTQSELASHAGYTEKHVSRVLNGHAPASTATWTRLIAAADRLCLPMTGDDHL